MTNICKGFSDSGGRKEVIKNLSVHFEIGKITAVVGKSGCGKTTILRLLAGMDKPDQGEIFIPTAKKCVLLFQEPRLMPWLSVRQNIEAVMPGKKKENTCIIQELLKQVHLQDAGDMFPSQLSGGMQQRTALARALAYQADVLLLDEPFAALDYFTRSKMQELLVEIEEKYHKTIILVTHQLEEAALLGNKIVLVQEGRISGMYELSHMTYMRDRLSDEMIMIQKQITEDLNKKVYR